MSNAPHLSTDLDLVLPPDAPLAPLLAEEKEWAKVIQSHARSKNTMRQYEGDWRAFVKWCAPRGVLPCPVADDALAAYLASLVTGSYARVARAYSAIAMVQREVGSWPANGCPPAIDRTLAGLRRTLGTAPKRQKTAITDRELLRFVQTFPVGTLAGQRDTAILLLTFFGAFRRSEIAALTCIDLTFDTEGLRVNVRRSKSDQEGKGHTKGIPYAGDPRLCAIRAIQAWKVAARVEEGPLFRPLGKGDRVLPEALGAVRVSEIVKRAAHTLGLDSKLFGGHSLRRGFITTAARKGKSLDAIMRQSGHSSVSTVRGYIEVATVFEDNAATGLV